MAYVQKRCNNCSYFCVYGSVYECRINPPVVTSLVIQVSDDCEHIIDHAAFPEVEPDWWCSKFVDDVSF